MARLKINKMERTASSDKSMKGNCTRITFICFAGIRGEPQPASKSKFSLAKQEPNVVFFTEALQAALCTPWALLSIRYQLFPLLSFKFQLPYWAVSARMSPSCPVRNPPLWNWGITAAGSHLNRSAVWPCSWREPSSTTFETQTANLAMREA